MLPEPSYEVRSLLAGLLIFTATNILLLKGGPVVGPHLGLLGQFLPGYSVSFGGSLIDLVCGLVLGFGGGYLTARFYNWFAGLRQSRHAAARQ